MSEAQKAYIELYDNFYSGKNRKAMFHCFTKLIEAIRCNDFSVLPKICTDDCIADYSTVGRLTGIEEIADGLKWPGPEVPIKKSTIWNFVARSNETGKGQQSVYIQTIMAIDDGVNIFPFLYGGQYCNSFIKTSEGWKINHIRFDLAYEFGNNLFVKDAWFLIDPQQFNGHKPMINSELEAPWYAIPEDCEPQSDAEQIFELQFEKVFGMDNGDYHLSMLPVADDHWQDFGVGNDYHGKKEYNNFLKSKHHKEARMQHANRMGDLKIEGDHAMAWMPRGEDHRLRNRVFTHENIHSMVTTGGHMIYAKKIEGKWIMYRIQFTLQKVEFIPIDDSTLAYDEFIVGGKKWNW